MCVEKCILVIILFININSAFVNKKKNKCEYYLIKNNLNEYNNKKKKGKTRKYKEEKKQLNMENSQHNGEGEAEVIKFS